MNNTNPNAIDPAEIGEELGETPEYVRNVLIRGQHAYGYGGVTPGQPLAW